MIFKTVFEVKLMHEYFLTDTGGETVFSLADQKQRLQFLTDQFALGRSSINTDLSFEFPDQLKSFYEGNLLKILPSYSGFRVVARVNKLLLDDGTLVYKPMATLGDTMNIQVLIRKKTNDIDRYTNGRIVRHLPSTHFFSNQALNTLRVFPYLTGSVSAVNGSYIYEQGELASFGANDLRFFYTGTAGAQWKQVKGNAFANENDRLLLPSKFVFSFGPEDAVRDVVFSLRKDGTVIKTIAVTSSENITATFLDFSGHSHLISISENGFIGDALLELEVSGNGYFKTFPLLISDSLYAQDVWAVISIAMRPPDGAFRLLDDDGYLKKRKSALGVWEEAPVFEIPVRSRHPFWRFINNSGKELKLIPELNDYLLKEDKVLVTSLPRALARSFFFLRNENSTQTKYVPNPLNYELKKDGKGRWCLDIMVPRSDMFPVI